MDSTGQPGQDGGNREAASAASAVTRPRYRPLVTVVIAVSAGIVLDRYGSASTAAMAANWFAAWWGLAAGCLLAWWLLWRGQRNATAAWLLLVAAAMASAAWHHARWSLFGRQDVARFAAYEATPACIDAVARETPERLPAPPPTPLRAIPGTERSQLLVNMTGIRDGTAWQPARGICQLTVNGHLLGLHPGDRLRIFGQLARPAPPLNPGEFDFAAHARADRRLARLLSSAPDCVTVTGAAGRWRLTSLLDTVRGAAQQLVRTFVGPQRAGLAAAILLGAREDLTPEETEPYLLTGTIHVLVVSGLNVAILALGLYALMRIGWLPRKTGLAVIMMVVVAYALLAELQPPVVRAAVLAVLMCIAAWTGRQGVAFNSLAAAALIVLAINPSELFRSGPQLSFLAVATLIWVGNWSLSRRQESADRLDQLLAATRPWYVRFAAWLARWNGWLLVTSIAVWLAALPLVLLRFHVVSPVAVLISPAVWIVVFLAMWSGFFMIVLGWLIPPLGAACGVVCNLSLGWLEGLVHWAEALPGGHFWAPGPAWWWAIGFYLGLVGAMLLGRRMAPPRWQAAALCGWILVGLAPPLARTWTRDGLECSFIAVGHGTCVVLQTPDGRSLLYDAGSLGSPEYATQMVAGFLWDRGVLRIDGIILSHADIDHYNAVPGLLERFRVGAVYVSPVMFDAFGDEAAADGPIVLRTAIASAGVPIREIWSGDRLRVDPEVTLSVLHPPRSGVVESDNANSITLAVEYAGRRVLLPGDLESPGLDDVMAELPYDCDVLMAPHHGSRRSDPPGLAAWCVPEWVVISGGSDADPEVRRTYQQAGAQVLNTGQQGTVEISLGRSHIGATTWLANRGYLIKETDE